METGHDNSLLFDLSQAISKPRGREFWPKNHKIDFRISLESSREGGFIGSVWMGDLGTFDNVILRYNKLCNMKMNFSCSDRARAAVSAIWQFELAFAYKN